MVERRGVEDPELRRGGGGHLEIGSVGRRTAVRLARSLTCRKGKLSGSDAAAAEEGSWA